jgi:hypothetical protein
MSFLKGQEGKTVPVSGDEYHWEEEAIRKG